MMMTFGRQSSGRAAAICAITASGVSGVMGCLPSLLVNSMWWAISDASRVNPISMRSARHSSSPAHWPCVVDPASVMTHGSRVTCTARAIRCSALVFRRSPASSISATVYWICVDGQVQPRRGRDVQLREVPRGAQTPPMRTLRGSLLAPSGGVHRRLTICSGEFCPVGSVNRSTLRCFAWSRASSIHSPMVRCRNRTPRSSESSSQPLSVSSLSTVATVG